MIPSIPLTQSGHSTNNLILQHQAPGFYGPFMDRVNSHPQMHFQQIVPHLTSHQIPNFSFHQNYNSTMRVDSVDVGISIGALNQTALLNNPYTFQQTLVAQQPNVLSNSSTFVSQPQILTPLPFNKMNQPQPHINLTFGRQHLHQIVARNPLHFCPYQAPAYINQQRFLLNNSWSSNSQLSMPTSTLFHPTNQTQHPPLLRMPTVIIRPNTNGSATIIQLNNCNQRSTGYYGRRIQVINGNCASNIKSSRQTRPVIKYNEESLIINKGECPICLDEMDRGDRIARLPCLCIYHKNCIDAWFSRSNTCPTHPPDD